MCEGWRGCALRVYSRARLAVVLEWCCQERERERDTNSEGALKCSSSREREEWKGRAQYPHTIHTMHSPVCIWVYIFSLSLSVRPWFLIESALAFNVFLCAQLYYTEFLHTYIICMHVYKQFLKRKLVFVPSAAFNAIPNLYIITCYLLYIVIYTMNLMKYLTLNI